MARLFGLCEAAQPDLIKKHCFGDCGKISAAGAIDTQAFGMLWVCCQEVCPFLRAQTDKPIGTSNWTGEEVFLRSIKDPDPPAEKDSPHNGPICPPT